MAAIPHLERAIELDVADVNRVSGDEQPSALSASALEHGQAQFDRLCRDRPELLRYRKTAGFKKLETWAVRRFAGAATGFVIHWDNSEPVTLNATGESVNPLHGYQAAIRISRRFPDIDSEAGRALNAERIWSMLVFELYNLKGVNAVRSANTAARKGLLSKAEFVEQCFQDEFRAIRETRVFYCNHFLPWAMTARIRSKPSYWYVADEEWWQSPEEALDAYPFDANYPWKVYGDQFSAIRQLPNAARRKPRSFRAFVVPSPLLGD